MEKVWRAGLTEFADEDSGGILFQTRIRASMKRVVSQIEQQPHDEERLKLIKDAIADLEKDE